MKALWRSIIDLFFPPLCPCCGKAIDDVSALVCSDCVESFDTTRHVIEPDNRVLQLFADLEKVKAAASYAYYYRQSALRKAILRLKYGGQPELGAWLGQLAALHFLQLNADWFDDVDVVVAVPMHPNRERARGYNQAEEIARGISQVIHKPLISGALARVADNTSQTHMTGEQRRKNVVGAFELKDNQKLKGQCVLLVDDIVTTGSTLRDCIRCLNPLRGTTFKVMTIGVPMHEGQIDESMVIDRATD